VPKADGRQLVVVVTREQSRFLNQEQQRLKRELNTHVSVTEIVQGMIELHMMRMTQLATEDPESVAWFYKYLAEQRDDQSG